MLSSYCIVSQNIMRSLYCMFFLFLLLKISMIQVIILNTGEIVIFPWTYLGGCNSCVFLVVRVKFYQSMIDFDYLIKQGYGNWWYWFAGSGIWISYMYSVFSICLGFSSVMWLENESILLPAKQEGINFSFYR